MENKKSNTLVTVVITILAMLVLLLAGYIIIDKFINKKTNTTVNENQNNVENNNSIDKQNNLQENNTTPTEDEVKEAVISYIKTRMENVIDYRINSLSFDNNTKEFKEMIKLDQDIVLVYVNYDLIRNGNGYTKEQGWIKSNQAHCRLIKNSIGKYEIQTCGSGW